MTICSERARTQSLAAAEVIRAAFKDVSAVQGPLSALFTDAARTCAVGVAGLPFESPACMHLMAAPKIAAYVRSATSSVLFAYDRGDVVCYAGSGERAMPADVRDEVLNILERVLTSPGELGASGELVLDLKSYAVGPHYAVNLLLGSRVGYPHPLCTTPKAAIDHLGRGSFRATGGEQVLATRCVIDPAENGEPANRQFYLTENGRQIFYSALVDEGVESASCTHAQGRTTISYQTTDGLDIRRTVFILPQEPGMPSAVEAQRVEISNRGDAARTLRIVMTGVFGIAGPETIANDVVYANIVQESEVCYEHERPVALTMYAQPEDDRAKKRFALLLLDGETMDEFCCSQSDFMGAGTLAHPELVGHLPCEQKRKMAPFFALAKTFNIQPGETKSIDELVGMSGADGDDVPFDEAFAHLLETYRDPRALDRSLERVVEFWDRYPSYFTPETDDDRFNAYVGRNLPFQVLYQTYVSRAFAWTQKSYRETGFREIQDIYASMYYLSAVGEDDLVRDLISNWARQVWRAGYANHDFTFVGKEPGDCSDDQLWLVQAVWRYVMLTGDTAFLEAELPVAGEDSTRSLWDTIMAILTYSGCISVGAHGLPLLDKADWNDTLKLDRVVYKGPEKERLYREQLAKRGEQWGAAWDNELSESVMNACLLKIAADEAAELGELIGRGDDASQAREISARVAESMQRHAWKGTFFARCLINDGRAGGYTYLGAPGDGLALEEGKDGTFFLNSYSWSILSGVATEEQISLMLDVVERELKSDAGLKLCTLVDFDRLGVQTGTALYFPGDRENGGVFKHAAMMAATASLQAARTVLDEQLAQRLCNLAYFMIDRTLPYRTMDNPYVLKGNPRFCTQYNNSETGENIGPMLSGTASWLTLALYEVAGVSMKNGTIEFSPVLRPGTDRFAYTLRLHGATVHVTVAGDAGRFRCGPQTTYHLDGAPCAAAIPCPASGEHTVEICL